MSFFSSQGFSGLGVGYREVGTRERGGLALGNISSPWGSGPCWGERGGGRPLEQDGVSSRMALAPSSASAALLLRRGRRISHSNIFLITGKKSIGYP